jgi:hypothetical protein
VESDELECWVAVDPRVGSLLVAVRSGSGEDLARALATAHLFSTGQQERDLTARPQHAPASAGAGHQVLCQGEGQAQPWTLPWDLERMERGALLDH